mgnify:CR=1 FL=1
MYFNINGCVAAEMLGSALAFCEEKMGCKEALSLLIADDPNAIEYFRYSLAKQVGSYLGENSESVQDVYMYPDTLEEEPKLTLPLILIVNVERHTAALESVVEAIQYNLLEEYRKMFVPITNNLSVFLHIYMIDLTDLRERRGLAASINSLYKPALRVWSSR